MDFDTVIAAHTAWKGKLHSCVEGKETLDPSTVGRDDGCVLGKWIHGEGAKFAADPAFAAVKSQHQAFHKCAADVVSQVKRGDTTGAKKALDYGQPFAKLSSELIRAITTLRSRVEKR